MKNEELATAEGEDLAELEVIAEWLAGNPSNRSPDKDTDKFQEGLELFGIDGLSLY